MIKFFVKKCLSKIGYRHLFLILLISTNYFGYAQKQNTTVDPRVYDKFDKADFDKLLAQNPVAAEFYQFVLDYSYEIIDLPEDKVKAYPDIKELKTVKTDKNGIQKGFNENIAEIITTGKFNVLKYDLRREPALRKGYRLGNTGKVIMFYSTEELLSKFHAQRNK